jgi:hypothetical protein
MDKNIDDLLIIAKNTNTLVAKSLLTLSNLSRKGVTALSEINYPADFFNAIAFLSSQAKAPLIEDYIKHKLNLNSVPSSINRGDGYHGSSNKYYEIKASTNNQANTLNLVQIRAWQDVDYYLAVFINENNLQKSYVFLLTKSQLKQELKYMNASASHGTTTSNSKNENVEYSLHLILSEDNKHFLRWQKKYFSNNIFKKLFYKKKEGKNGSS